MIKCKHGDILEYCRKCNKSRKDELPVDETVMRYDVIKVEYGYDLIDKIENKVIDNFTYQKEAWKQVGKLLAEDAIKKINT